MTGVLISLAQIWHINKVAAGTLTDIVVGRRATKYSSTGKDSCGLHTRKNTAELGKSHTQVAFVRTTEYCEEVRGKYRSQRGTEDKGEREVRFEFEARYIHVALRLH